MTESNPEQPREDRRSTPGFLQSLRLATLVPILVTAAIIVTAISRPRVRFDLDLPWTTWTVIAAGPLIAFASTLYTAFRYHGRARELRDVATATRDWPVFSVRTLGWASLLVAAYLGVFSSLGTPVWIFVLALEVMGVGAILFAAGLSTRAPDKRKKAPAAAEPEEAPEDPKLRGLYRDVAAAAKAYHRSARRWAQVNYTLGFLTALFAGGSGVTGLSSASGALKTVFAVLAVVGAALTSLATTLKTSESHATAKLIADKLDGLARDIRWSVSLADESSGLKGYVERFNELTTTRPQAPQTQD